MYGRIAAVIGLSILIYGLIEGPDHFYNKGYEAGYKVGAKDIESSVATAVESAKRDNELAIEKEKLANEIKFKEINNENESNLKKLKSDYDRKLANGLLFNKNRICSSGTNGETKGESIQGSNEGTSSNWLLPETYSRDFTEVAYEADKLSETVRTLQNTINKSNCFVKE